MHRFRKKSETRRSTNPEATRPIDPDHPEPLPVLPSTSDFRTSLILPDLTRRFTLLRSEDGGPVGLEHLRARFAEQRVRGALNQVSEEEEAMILEALGRMRVRTTAAEQQDDFLSDPGTSPRQSSTNSLDTSTSSLMGNVIGSVSPTPAPKNTKRGQKRYSNNLFGSGKFRDDVYIRSARGSGRSTLSTAGSDASTISRTLQTNNSFLRPGSPEEADSSGISAPSSPNALTDRESLSTFRSPFFDSSPNTSTEIRLSHTFHPDAFKRASLALEEVIREIEEEAEEPGVDDDIVLLRSPTADQRQRTVNDVDHVEQEREGDEEVFTVTALSDDHAMDQPSAQSSSLMHEASKRMSPTPRTPGYIPGMQRPMTPHDILEPEEQLSITPRATSPRLPLNGSYNSAMNATNSSLSRRDSNASTAKQPSRTGTPLSASTGGFLSRSLNGRYTPTEERQGPDPFDSDRNPSKRRPASPLSNTSFQPMMVLPNESPSTFSRPNTPSSNATLQSQHSQHQSITSTSSFRPTHVRHGSGHSRNGSISSLSEVLHNPNFNPNPNPTSTRPDVNKTITRNARSPALPDSPYIESGRSSAQGHSPGDKERTGDHERTPSVISGMELGSPFSFSRMLRSPTPNGNVPPTTTAAGMATHQESVGKRAKSPSFSIDQPNTASTSTTTTKMGKHQKYESGSSFVLSLGPSTQPLVLTPFLNSSRSSFGSEGSSYHSIDEENGKKDRVKVLFAKIEGEPPEWHDFTDVGIDTARVPSGPEEVSFRSLLREEELVKQLSGLSRDDFVAVQERLLDAVQLRVDRGERDKAGSVMKKRRPSTSQSFYTNGATMNGRVGSPSPVHTRSASPSAANVLSSIPAAGSTTTTTTTTTTVETKVQPAQIQTQTAKAKANALLNSVIDDIESPQMSPGLLTPQSSVQSQGQDIPESPGVSESVDSPTRRNRDLADALFGPQDSVDGPAPPVLHISTTSPLNISRSVSTEGTLTSNASTPHLLRTPEMAGTRLFMGQLSSPNLSIPEDDELAKQVLAKVEAATMALRKSPSNPKFPDGLGPPIPPATKRKVDRDQISSPTLLSASMSVDTIALRPTTPINPPNSGPGSNSPGTLKLGQRFKKLRGTLKAKPLPTGEEVSPFPVDLKPSESTSPATSPNLSQRPLVHSGDVSISSTEHSGSLSAVSATTVMMELQASPAPAPPSPGPGFKGFMARFRKNKDRSGDSNLLTTKNTNGLMLPPGSPGTNTSSLHPPPSPAQSAPLTRLSFNGRRSNSIKVKKRSDDLNQTLAAMSANKVTTPEQEMEEENEDQIALRQLWDAASQLKLDSTALNNLVARSPSNVSKSSTWSKAMTRTSLVPSRKSRPIDTLQEEGSPSSRPSFSEGRSSFEGLQRVSSKVAGPMIRKLSIKKHSNSIRRRDETLTQQTGSTGLRSQQQQPKQDASQPQTHAYQSPSQPEEKPNPRNTIVRRTIIVPSETKGLPTDIQNLLRKGSTKRRRSASAASTHSIQDRAPTPPPPKNGPGVSGKRFSTNVSVNPMPGTSSSHNNLEIPGAHEKVNSAYDSLYDMYAGESRAPSVAHQRDDIDGAPPLESGPAIEVIELANGETVWSIVNGLRGDDSESFYGDRASFASEYSLRDGPNDGVQLHFKEHVRSGSKGSMSSFVSSKKQGTGNRPETKVFFSSSAQIGRLIETLSKGTDSGSFNILPHRPQSHATSQSVGSSSEMQWTVEERLEQLLGSMN